MKFIVFIYSFLLLTQSSFAQWQRVEGPYSGKTNCIINNGSDVYTCFEGGAIYLSSDKGQKWLCINRSMSNFKVNTIAHNGIKLFAGTDSGVYTTSDNGKTWNSLNTIFNNQFINYIGIHGDYILIGSETNVFISTDQGSNWDIRNTGISNFSISKSLYIDNTFYISTLGGGVYHSTDLGQNWSIAGQIGNGFFINDLMHRNNDLFAATTYGIYTCKLSDLNWRYINLEFGEYFSFTTSMDGKRMFCGTNFGPKVSNTNGTTWLSANADIERKRVKKILMVEGVLYAGMENEAIYVSNDEGYTWTHSSIGINSALPQCMIILDKQIVLNYQESNLEVSNDQGFSWKTLNISDVGDRILKIVNQQNKSYALSNSSFLYISEDKGKTWNQRQITYPLYQAIDFTYNNGFSFAISYQGKPFRSINEGKDWMRVSTDIDNEICYKIDNFNNNLITAHENGISISYDNGDSWFTYSDAFKSKLVSKIATYENSIIVGTQTDGLFISMDSTQTWLEINNGLNNLDINDIMISKDQLFVATKEGVYFSKDTGKNWQAINEGLRNLKVTQITELNGHLYIGTRGDGIWKRQIWETTDLNKISQVNYKFYPNPSNGFLSLESSENITQICIYDAVGNELQVIKNTSGNSIANIDLTHLAPGIYLIKLQTEKGSAIEKIIIE